MSWVFWIIFGVATYITGIWFARAVIEAAGIFEHHIDEGFAKLLASLLWPFAVIGGMGLYFMSSAEAVGKRVRQNRKELR